MKLVRFGSEGSERPGVIIDGILRDLSQHIDDISGPFLSDEVIARLQQLDTSALPTVEGSPRLGPCVNNVSKLICIGLNYADHAAEMGVDAPPYPDMFMKSTTAINGASDDIVMPRGSQKTDWEVELAFVIGKRAKNVLKKDALTHIAGYCIMSDISEREYQTKYKNDIKAKSFDTFAPLGPWLCTRDEVEDPQNLNMSVDVNGKRMQTGNTKTMIFGVADIVEHLSMLMTLNPGDVISTGTPPGVGLGHKPPTFLKDGDFMEVQVEGLGMQKLTVRKHQD